MLLSKINFLPSRGRKQREREMSSKTGSKEIIKIVLIQLIVTKRSH